MFYCEGCSASAAISGKASEVDTDSFCQVFLAVADLYEQVAAADVLSMTLTVWAIIVTFHDAVANISIIAIAVIDAYFLLRLFLCCCGVPFCFSVSRTVRASRIY